jgi:hypothetical protein
VRCGHCNTLFDGARNRTEIPASDVAAGVSPHVSALEARRSLLARLSARTEPSVGLNAAELSMSGTSKKPSGSGKAQPRAGARTPEAPGAPRSRRRLVRALTGPIVLLLALACALQYAWWQREYIRVSWPPSEIAYQTLCRLTGCVISPARDIDLLQIASMSLRQVDDPHHLALQVVLHNRSTIPQAYPAIELTLTDAHNQASIRKVITPAQYLNADTSADTGIGSHAQRTLQMRIDTTTIPANNYRVTIFYP